MITDIDGVTKTTIAGYLGTFFGGYYKKSDLGYDVLALLVWILIARAGFLYAAGFVRHEKR